MVMVLTVKYSDNIYFHQSDQSMVLIQIHDCKKKGYAPTCMAFKTYGKWGKEAQSTISQLASSLAICS